MPQLIAPGIFFDLLANVSLILSFTFILTLIRPALGRVPQPLQSTINGLLFGLCAILLPPISLAPGAMFAGRGILMVIAGMFGGWQAALASTVLVTLHRFVMNNPNLYVGLTGTTLLSLLGWYANRRLRTEGRFSTNQLLLISFMACLIALGASSLLPKVIVQGSFGEIALAVVVFYPPGIFLVAVLLMRDDRRAQIEQALVNERNLLRTITDSSPDHIFFKDPQGRFLLSNLAHTLIAGAGSPEKVLGKRSSDFFPLELVEQYEADDLEVLKSGQPAINLERKIQDHQGNVSWALINKIPVRDSTGAVMGVLGISRDITERKQAESQALELAREKERAQVLGTFLADARHDLNTPLTVLNTSLYLLERAQTPEKRQEHIDTLKAHTARLQKLIDDLFTMAHLDLGTHQKPGERCSVNDLIVGITSAQRWHHGEKSLDVRLNLNEESSATLSCGDDISRALGEIIHNALIYTPDGGTVTISTHTEQNKVRIVVQDTGIGISEADLPCIFKRFYRADKARSSSTGGTGLGLSIARKIIESHHGTVEVQSALNVGTTFTVWLPLAS